MNDAAKRRRQLKATILVIRLVASALLVAVLIGLALHWPHW